MPKKTSVSNPTNIFMNPNLGMPKHPSPRLRQYQRLPELNVDVLQTVFKNLPREDIEKVGMVNRQWRQAAKYPISQFPKENLVEEYIQKFLNFYNHPHPSPPKNMKMIRERLINYFSNPANFRYLEDLIGRYKSIGQQNELIPLIDILREVEIRRHTSSNEQFIKDIRREKNSLNYINEDFEYQSHPAKRSKRHCQECSRPVREGQRFCHWHDVHNQPPPPKQYISGENFIAAQLNDLLNMYTECMKKDPNKCKYIFDRIKELFSDPAHLPYLKDFLLKSSLRTSDITPLVGVLDDIEAENYYTTDIAFLDNVRELKGWVINMSSGIGHGYRLQKMKRNTKKVLSNSKLRKKCRNVSWKSAWILNIFKSFKLF